MLTWQALAIEIIRGRSPRIISIVGSHRKPTLQCPLQKRVHFMVSTSQSNGHCQCPSRLKEKTIKLPCSAVNSVELNAMSCFLSDRIGCIWHCIWLQHDSSTTWCRPTLLVAQAQLFRSQGQCKQKQRGCQPCTNNPQILLRVQ